MSARAELILNLRGNLVRGLQDVNRQFAQTQNLGTRAVAASGRALDALGTRYTALATGAAAAGAVRFVGSLERRLTRLGISANLGAREVRSLNDEIYRTAQAPDVRIDPAEILSAIESIVEKTGDLEFARNNLRNIAVAIQATGASGAAIGELVAELQKLDVADPANVLRVLDTFNLQGKEGAFTLKELAALGPRVVSAYASAVKGQRDAASVLREMGAALQAIRGATGSSEQAATAFERLVSELQDAQKQKLFKQLGIDIFQVGADGQKALRPINELLAEIFDKTRGDRTVLGGLFGDEAIRAFSDSAIRRIPGYMAAQGDGAQTLKDSARAAGDAAAAMTNLTTAWKRFADVNLSPVLQDAADALNAFSPEELAGIGEGLKKVAIGFGALYALRAIFRGARGLAGLLPGGAANGPGAAGSAAAGLPGGMPVPLPVIVVNKQFGQAPGGLGGGAAGSGGGATAASRLATLAKGAGYLTASGGVGYGIGTVLNKALIDGTSVGNAIGASVARVLAAFGNDEARQAVERSRNGGLLQGELTIRIDQDGRARLASAKTNQPGVDMTTYFGPAGAN